MSMLDVRGYVRAFTSSRSTGGQTCSVDEETGKPECCVRLKAFWKQTSAFHSSHRKFVIRLSLACSVAFWVALFSIPLYFSAPYFSLFGSRGDAVFHETKDLHEQEVACSDSMVGRMENIGDQANPHWVQYTGQTPWPTQLTVGDKFIWCGWLPAVWQDYWPNIAQFIVFTVYVSTGDTIRLAWQGLIGTLFACINLELMTFLYPGGAAGAVCETADCVPQPYNEAIVMADVILVLFLFLFSRADENTIKFGMSWHVFFMMDFMNPTKKMPSGQMEELTGFNLWKNDLTADVFLTSVVGAVVSILATIIPRCFCCMKPLANRCWVSQNSLDCAEKIGSVWQESVEYMLGSKAHAKKFQLQRKIADVRSKLLETKKQVQVGWWETWQCGSPEQVRLKLHAFLSGAEDVQRTMYSLGNSITSEDFSGQHCEFCGKLAERIRKLHSAASDLIVACAKAAVDGTISEDEEAEIRGIAEEAETCQRELLQQYREAVKSGICANLAEEVTFVFALSCWTTTTQDMLRLLSTPEQRMSWRSIVCSGIRDTWGAEKVLEREHLKFAFRNLIPISTCFILGYAVPSTCIFIQYDATMANTLALLITRFSTSAVQKNFHRTLGVLLGKFLPILFKATWVAFPCQSTERGILQLLSLFLFVSMWCYVYYSSKMWSTVAVLVAGYGVYPLMVPCDDLNEDSYYVGLYKELGQVTVAMVLQFVIESALHASPPGELAVRKMERAAHCLREGLQGFFQADLNKMAKGLETLRYLDEAKTYMAEADPSVRLAPCWRADFKFRLYSSSLEKMQLLQSDFYMLWTACLDQGLIADDAERTSLILKPLANHPAIQDLTDRLEGHSQKMLEALFAALRHTSETPLQNEVVKEAQKVSVDCGISEDERERLYRSLTDSLPPMPSDAPLCLDHDPHARGTVAIRALENSIKHLEDISSLIIGEDIF
ncbi:unnamed protein product [Symbiodinium necroappetens]|uniref:Uncharacterized protein n=1 Tax=Symbiodinium necroappetens TaxID=1628268 RepID=A0A813CRQ8_9DINO|nr:unnamed protein product [Symbiodinium necroappetens]|eukprot:CAMPEP_0181435298 /NCGR_PEP_ID=MMETSP1110-20121109/20259_1 /TAXON_ID=174948 /ORGANISM="Symbiodinium sp., Strain CCMP421" /LENGTH=944 /DNA_ID=CAMNT_0023558825 /DNA_START=81 /DNA_END=2915 /DNA_ORIENTATION=+